MTEKYVTCTIGGKEYEVLFRDSGISFDNIKWTFWDKITLPFYRSRRWFKDSFYAIKYAYYRLRDGYDCRDVFNIDYGFTVKYKKILENFKKYNNGYPTELTWEAWNTTIDEMLYHLQFMTEEDVEAELISYVDSESYYVADDTIYKIMEEHKNKFFELFSKYFYSLWY